MKKLLLSMMLALCLPFAASAQDDTREMYTVFTEADSTLTFYYDDQKGTREGAVFSMVYDEWGWSPQWSTCHNKVSHVVFDSSFADALPDKTKRWFYDFRNLKSIVGMEYLNTTNVTDMSGMFYSCFLLENIDVSHFNTSNVTIMGGLPGEGMFSGCRNLKSLDVSNFNTENVTDMTALFSGCSSLMSLDLSNFNTSNVTSMASMFSKCSGLTSLDLSNFVTSNVLSMSCMFYRCSGLTSLDLSNFDTSNVTDMSSMFAFYWGDGTSKLTNLDISSFNTEKVEDLSGMFGDLSELAVLDVSHFNTSNVTNMRGLFEGCSSLTSLNVSNFDTQRVTNMGLMFKGCSSLTSLNVSNFDTKNVTSMDGMFDGCNGLESLDVTNFDTNNVTDMSSMFSGCINLCTLDVSNFDTQNVANMLGMFSSCQSLETIDVSSFDTRNVTNMRRMFAWCEKLADLDLSNFNTRKVSNMSDMFRNCKSLGTVDISNFTVESFDVNELYPNNTGTSFMFAECTQLTTIYSNNDWAASGTIDSEHSNYMFNGCRNLRGSAGTSYLESQYNDITFARPDTPETPGYFSVKEPEMYVVYVEADSTLTFYYDNQKGVREGVAYELNYYHWQQEWREHARGIARAVFDESFADARPTSTAGWFMLDYWDYRDDVLQNVSPFREIEGLKRLNTSCVTNMACMFYGCSGLSSLDLSGFNTQNVTDMTSMFSMCSSLKSLDLNKFDTQNVTSMSQMFYECGLEYLDLSSFDTHSVSDMSGMFACCRHLTSIDISSFNIQNVTDMSIMFNECDALSSIYCNDDWSANENNFDSGGMFSCCTQLVGGAGTTFDWEHTDATYARPDSPETPGYFTSVSKMYSVFNEESATLTFYYDPNKNSREGTVYGMTYDEQGYPEWNACKTDVQKVVFDSSFAEARPESTSEWFSGFSSLLQIEGLENLNTENVTNMTGMFRSCWRLTEIDLSHFNTSNVTNMTAMFYNCQSLISLDLSSFDTHNVTSMASMFIACKNLEYVDVSSFDTKNVTVMMWMFSDCNSLKELDLSSFDTQNVDDIQGMFIGCKSLTSLSLANFNTENATKMVSMFSGCENLVSLDLSGFNTRSARHLSSMFMGCKSLQNLDLSHFDTSNISWFYSMFEGCESLKSLNINSFVFKDGSYRDGMFTSVPSDCVLYLPKGMTVSDFEGYEQGDLVHDAQTNIVETNEDGTATCEELVMADDDYFMVRTPFEAKKAVFRFHLNNEEQPAGMPRRINEQVPDGHRVPIYIPFAFDSKQFGQVYQMGMLTDDKTAVQFDELQEPTTEANSPYIINSNGDDIVAENVMVEASERMEATGADEMLGVIEQTLVPMGGYWFDAANDKLLLAGEDEEVSVLAGRGYFLLPSAVGAASLDALFGPQIATGVASTPNSHQPTLIYDLQGRRLSPADAHSAKPRIAIVRMSDGTTRKTVRR